MNIFILIAACATALLRPVWGILLLFVLECSLFNLGERFATAKLPIGFASPMDVLLFAILFGALRHRAERRRRINLGRADSELPDSSYSNRARRMLTASLLPYVGWTVCAIVFGFAFDAETRSNTIAIRAAMSTILPWLLVPSVWLVRDNATQLIKGVFIIAIAVSVLHLAIQLFDVRSVMLDAYHFGDETSAPMQWRRHEIETSDVVRGLPQGSFLILFTSIGLLGRLLVRTKRLPIWLYVALGLLVSATIITVVRTLSLLLIIGFGLTIVLAANYRIVRLHTILAQIVVGGILTITIAAGILITNPQYYQLWETRLDSLANDSAIFSRTTVRGLNNLSSLEAIEARPLMGYGYDDYPSKYAYVSYHSDIHPLLGITLCSGVIGLTLLLYGIVRLTLRSMRYCRTSPAYAAIILPYAAIFVTAIVINSLGAGGTLEARGLLLFCLFIGLFATAVADLPNLSQQQRLSLPSRSESRPAGVHP